MSRKLYVFVDESGNHSQDEYFVVAGCWGFSDWTDPSEVFDPTVQRLSNQVNRQRDSSTSISELKGSQLSSDILSTLLYSLEKTAIDDKTIRQDKQPWQKNLPLRYSIAQIHPSVASEVLLDAIGSELEAYKITKTVVLLSALDPLFRQGRLNSSVVEEVVLVLDSQVWKRPSETLNRALQAVDERPAICESDDIRFETRDSAQTPGVQLADIAAYSWARHLRQGDHGDAVHAISDQFRFARH